MADLLSAEGFDAGKVIELIDGSSLGDTEKSMLKLLVEKAGDNPDLVAETVSKVKEALGQ